MKLTRWIVSLVVLVALPLAAQDKIVTGTGTGIEKIRMALPEFPSSGDGTGAELNATFNAVLWNDLEQAGLFEMVSRSFYPLGSYANPGSVKLDAWANPPAKAGMLVFGNSSTNGGSLTVQGWLYDVTNTQTPQVLAKQYKEVSSIDNARLIAHEFANEIISRLGGGINGIAQSRIYYVHKSGAHKEIWVMDYDGANQHPVTHLGSISLGPKVSPDGGRIAFTSYASGAPQIHMYSVEVGRLVSFPSFGGYSSSPSWAPSGTRIAFSSKLGAAPNLFSTDARGGGLKRLTVGSGPDMSPSWNPKTGDQIVFCSGRTGLPQIYTIASDGTNMQRLTPEGYAVSPSWSPNGQFLAFAWIRHYGPGAPGAQDIYIMDLASHQWVQLTHGGGRNDSPSWSPDGRHIVFQSNRTGSEELWTMLANGSQLKQLTTSGGNSEPDWSIK